MTFRPDIGDGNWGGFDGTTCGAVTQTLDINFVEGKQEYLNLFLFIYFVLFGRNNNIISSSLTLTSSTLFSTSVF